MRFLRGRWAVTFCAVMATVLVALGAVLLGGRVHGVTTSWVTVDGVPLLTATPADQEPLDAGVVVVHGFAGSARLMRGFADTLARRGYVVVIPDLSGHGTNTTALPDLNGGEWADRLQHDVDVAVGHLRSAYGLSVSRIALVGHSMGAGAVTRYATEHPAIAATVAISLVSADDLPRDPARPRNLLLLTGGLEFPGFHAAAREAVARAYPAASPGQTVGDPRAGTARRASVVALTEHISVLFADDTHRQTAQWIDTALTGSSAPVEPHPRDRLVPAALALLGMALGLVPVAAALLPRRAGQSPVSTRDTTAWPFVVVGTIVGLVAAVALAPILVTARLALAVGGYAAGFVIVVGVTLVVTWALARRQRGDALVADLPDRRTAIAAPLLVTYACVAIALPIHMGLTNALPSGQRWWLLPVVIGSMAVLLLGVELVGTWLWLRACLLGLTVFALLVGAAIGSAPGFILLVVPLLGVLFAWHLAWSVVLSHRGAPAWLRAVVGAVIVGWPIAAALPVVVTA